MVHDRKTAGVAPAATATGSAALLALSLTTDAQGAVVTGNTFSTNGVSVSPLDIGAFSVPPLTATAFGGLANFSFRPTGYIVGNGQVQFRGTSSSGYGYIFGLTAGQQVSPALAFYSLSMSWLEAGIDAGYIGVRFEISGETHYGWMEFSRNKGRLTVPSWGYETTPDTAITPGAVPEPASVALLACGAAGLLAFRRRFAA